MLYLGIDQHKSQLTVNVRGEDGETILKRQVSTPVGEGSRSFFADFAEQARREGGFMAILEVCGMNPWLIDMLRKHGCREIVVTQPTTRSEKKTNRPRRHFRSNLLWTQPSAARGREASARDAADSTADAAGSRGSASDGLPRRVVEEAHGERLNAIHKILRKHNLEQESDREVSDAEGSPLAGKVGAGRIGPPGNGFPASAMDALGRAVGGRRSQDCRAGRNQQAIENFAIDAGDRRVRRVALAARIGPIEDFPTADSLANYWGLTPRCRNSGDATQRLGSITKRQPDLRGSSWGNWCCTSSAAMPA